MESTTGRKQHLVRIPSGSRDEEMHTMKYLILNEVPKEYICDQGCVHDYPKHLRVGRPIASPSSPKPTTPRTTSAKPKRSTVTNTRDNSTLNVLKKDNSKLPRDYSSDKDIKGLQRYNSLKTPKLTSKESPCNLRRNSPLICSGYKWQESSSRKGSANLRSGSFCDGKPKRIQSPGDKKYDKNDSDVYSRLYPYKFKPVESLKDVEVRVMDWNNYHRLNVIYDFMDELEKSFPSLCTVGVVGKSIEGRDLKLLKISNGNAKNTAVWMDAGIHAREWIGPAVNTFVANYIARNFDRLPKSCRNKDWYFMPVVNADGYEYSHTKCRMWRKNRAWLGNKCVGVDINRNFSVAWGGKGSSDDPDHNFYRGTAPFSEPETCALKNVLLDAKLPFKIYLTLHAFGEVIIFPFAHSDDLCPDYVRLLNGAAVMSRAIYNTNGTTYRVGVSKDVMYRASGTSNDWCYGAVGIPWCYLIELRSKKHRFKLPAEEIKETSQEILNCVLALVDYVDKYPVEQDAGDFLNIWKEEVSTIDVMVHANKITQAAGLLHQREIPYSIAVSNVNALLEKEQGNDRNKLNFHKIPGIMDWNSYHRLDSIYNFMNRLATEYPYLVTLVNIGKSVEGRKIVMMKISNGNTENSGVWIDGSIHPREWISTAVVTYFADKLVRTYCDQPSCVTNKDWYILPVLNPDGYEYTHNHDRMWRKNRARYGECVGVDLNRNFSHGWGENGEEGSSEDPGNIFFRGPEPFSEPETTAVRNAITHADINFKVFLSFHSFGEVIIFPWGYTSNPCHDYVELLEGATAMSKAIYQTSGHVYKVGSTKDLMYYAAGTSTDWSYGTCKIPYSYMIELRSKKFRFILPTEEIVPTSTEVYNAIMRLMDFIDHRCKSTQACVCRK